MRLILLIPSMLAFFGILSSQECDLYNYKGGFTFNSEVLYSEISNSSLSFILSGQFDSISNVKITGDIQDSVRLKIFYNEYSICPLFYNDFDELPEPEELLNLGYSTWNMDINSPLETIHIDTSIHNYDLAISFSNILMHNFDTLYIGCVLNHDGKIATPTFKFQRCDSMSLWQLTHIYDSFFFPEPSQYIELFNDSLVFNPEAQRRKAVFYISEKVSELPCEE